MPNFTSTDQGQWEGLVPKAKKLAPKVGSVLETARKYTPQGLAESAATSLWEPAKYMLQGSEEFGKPLQIPEGYMGPKKRAAQAKASPTPGIKEKPSPPMETAPAQVTPAQQPTPTQQPTPRQVPQTPQPSFAPAQQPPNLGQGPIDFSSVMPGVAGLTPPGEFASRGNALFNNMIAGNPLLAGSVGKFFSDYQENEPYEKLARELRLRSMAGEPGLQQRKMDTDMLQSIWSNPALMVPEMGPDGKPTGKMGYRPEVQTILNAIMGRMGVGGQAPTQAAPTTPPQQGQAPQAPQGQQAGFLRTLAHSGIPALAGGVGAGLGGLLGIESGPGALAAGAAGATLGYKGADMLMDKLDPEYAKMTPSTAGNLVGLGAGLIGGYKGSKMMKRGGKTPNLDKATQTPPNQTQASTTTPAAASTPPATPGPTGAAPTTTAEIGGNPPQMGFGMGGVRMQQQPTPTMPATPPTAGPTATTGAAAGEAMATPPTIQSPTPVTGTAGALPTFENVPTGGQQAVMPFVSPQQAQQLQQLSSDPVVQKLLQQLMAGQR